MSVLHDADTGMAWETSDLKLKNVPATLIFYQSAESSRFENVRKVGILRMIIGEEVLSLSSCRWVARVDY